MHSFHITAPLMARLAALCVGDTIELSCQNNALCYVRWIGRVSRVPARSTNGDAEELALNISSSVPGCITSAVLMFTYTPGGWTHPVTLLAY